MNAKGQFELIDIIGNRYGQLTVLRHHCYTPNGSSKWWCRCDCGAELAVWADNLKRERFHGCHECTKKYLSHIRTVHGHKYTLTYRVWGNMISRCENKNHSSYANYGGRGITVCERWHSFEAFLEDMGEAPEGLSIERVDNNGPYCKENCKWATLVEQCNNRRSNRFLTFNGKAQTLSQWARELGMDKTTIRKRLLKGWPIEKVLSQEKFFAGEKNFHLTS